MEKLQVLKGKRKKRERIGELCRVTTGGDKAYWKVFLLHPGRATSRIHIQSITERATLLKEEKPKRGHESSCFSRSWRWRFRFPAAFRMAASTNRPDPFQLVFSFSPPCIIQLFRFSSSPSSIVVVPLFVFLSSLLLSKRKKRYYKKRWKMTAGSRVEGTVHISPALRK